MSGSSFRIDLDEVEAAVKAIKAMLDDMEGPTARLEAVINQIKPTVYGTDAVGKSLTGGSSSVGGLADHQQQVFAGVKAYLQNSAQMAANLDLVVQRYRETEEAQTAELQRLNGGQAGSAPVATEPAQLRQVDAIAPSPVSVTLPPTATQDAGYHNPDAPQLDYNERDSKPDPEPRPAPGGGHNQLI
ncbi:hypothetical protein [Kitasatospora paranensis]|uniref:PE domain-containing protein n=1 Tax=Kitasatospora paranensis TaxID=258053 RepID=A0ABW2G230_9ACTN